MVIRMMDLDPYLDTGKTCLGGGMHCPTASSYNNVDWTCRNWKFLWSPYEIGQTINPLYFHRVVSFYVLLSFFPCLISAATHWMSTVLQHMVWP